VQIKFPMGWDVAYNNCNTHWDPILGDVDTPPDWSAGIVPYPDFVICKASQALFDDFTFASNWQQLGTKGTCRGAYHFYQDYKTSGAQAEYFVRTVNNAGGIKDGDVLVMDWEEEGKMSLKKIIDFIWNVRRLTGISPERTPLYSRNLLLGALNFDTLNQSEKDYIKTIPLWIAGTFNNPDQVDEYDSIPPFFIPDQSKWGKAVLWQYGLDVNPVGMVTGFPGGLDFDWVDPVYFSQWKALTGDPIIPPEEEMPTYKVTTTGKGNIRATGGLPLGTDIGDFMPGQVGYGTEVLGSPTGSFYCLKVTAGADVEGWVFSRYNNAPTYATIEAVVVPPVENETATVTVTHNGKTGTATIHLV